MKMKVPSFCNTVYYSVNNCSQFSELGGGGGFNAHYEQLSGPMMQLQKNGCRQQRSLVAHRMRAERHAVSPAMHIVLSASYCCPYRHERSKRATTLEHHFADTLDQFSSPQAIPESRKASKEGPRCHAYAEANRESHLDPVPTAGAPLVATWHRYRHGVSVGCGS